MKRHSSILFLLFLLFLLFSAIPCIAAGPNIPGYYGTVVNLPKPAPNTVPVLKPGGTLFGAAVSQPASNYLLIQQSQPRAIIDWQTFNIGENARTHFDQQKNADWAALNRIWDRDPSQIWGRLTADGKIYLINQNGILFGPGSQVNVHALVASSLNLRDEDFLGGALRFRAENYQDAGNYLRSGVVSNHGIIQTDELGSVFLIAPDVENAGAILTAAGQAGLAAGESVDLFRDQTPGSTRSALVVSVTGSLGSAVNFEQGAIHAETGLVGMYGKLVRQDGLIRAVTAVKRDGRIELRATERISTGPGSLTVTPITESAEKVHESFSFSGGEISLKGLDPAYPLYPQVQVGRIEHRGTLAAPSGKVSLEAVERVYIGEGARIDVSGSRIFLPAEANLISTKLGSVDLRDDYGQKDGVLKGAEVRVDANTGSAIGDIAGALASREQTALERSTKGGEIHILASSGDIILRSGAELNFAGGAVHYGEGHMDITRLLSGNRVYDVASAPQWVRYDKILGLQKVAHKRYGISESYAGLYYGGAQPVADYVEKRVEGADAGALVLLGRQVVLDGRIDGSATQGVLQTRESDPLDELGNPVARGLRIPRGGSLTIGRTPQGGATAESEDFLVSAILVRDDTAPLPEAFGPDGAPDRSSTILSARRLNEAGLGDVALYANTTIVTAAGSLLSLLPGGSFTLAARQIEHRGAVQAPSGTINLYTQDNITSFADVSGAANAAYVPLNQRIVIAGGSRLDASGQRMDDTKAGAARNESGHTARTRGGSVSIQDRAERGEGVFIAEGAIVDVRGGYRIDGKGKVSGGDAGSLNIQGSTLSAGGDLRGHSLVGSAGGTITLHAREVRVTQEAPPSGDIGAEGPIPSDMKGKLILSGKRLDDTGFTRIELKSIDDMKIESGARLAPSVSKDTASPPGAVQSGSSAIQNTVATAEGPSPGQGGLVRVAQDDIGPSSVKLSAGVLFPGTRPEVLPNDSAGITVDKGAHIGTAPGGEVRIEAPQITMSGILDAPAGKIGLKTTRQYNLIVSEGGQILARGHNRQETKALMPGVPAGFTTQAGGRVLLEAADGSIVLHRGTLIDVSGSEPVDMYVKGAGGLPQRVRTAGEPGELSLLFTGDLHLEGRIEGRARMEGLPGGSLSIGKKNVLEGYTLPADLARHLRDGGFDSLSVASTHSIAFESNSHLSADRSLIVDAPVLQGAAGSTVSLKAPWVRIRNTHYPSAAVPNSGDARLDVDGGWIDLEGHIVLSGFGDVRLASQGDIRLSDRFYSPQNYTPKWAGGISSAGHLTMNAARIYTTTLSDYRVTTGGKVTILPGAQPFTGFIPSAGSTLSISADGGIEHRGVLAAPAGRILLSAEGGMVFLGEGSIVTTSSDMKVKYGSLQDVYWTMPDKIANAARSFEAAPAPAVSISGRDVIVKERALVDVSGGGEVFAYEFLPGIEGSVDPMKKTGRYVILPSRGPTLPGQSVYIAQGAGLMEGAYSVLPEEYAFLPGALVLSELKQTAVPGMGMKTQEGYDIAAGYVTVAGTSIRSPSMKAFSVRAAADVLGEGHYNIREIRMGDAGSLTLSAETTIVDGTIAARAVPGFAGGTIALSGRVVIIQAARTPLPEEFGFSGAIPQGLVGKMIVSSSTLNDKGFREISLGNPTTTDTVVVDGGSRIEAPSVKLAARNSITVQSGAQIEAVSRDSRGEASFVSPSGTLNVEEGAVIHATDAVNLDVRAMDLKGALRVDHSALNLAGERILFVPAGTAPSGPGLFLTQAMWQDFSAFEDIGLISRSDIVFRGDYALSVAGELTLDAARLAGENSQLVTLAAQSIVLRNGNAGSAGAGLAGTGTLRMSAGEITVGRGDVLLDGYRNVEMRSEGDLVFKGVGALRTGANLDLTAARFATTYGRNGNGAYESADFRVQAGPTLVLRGSGGTPGALSLPGGMLEMSAGSVVLSGLVELASGRMTLNAGGAGPADGVVLQGGAAVRMGGSDFAPGGTLSLRAQAGFVRLESGSLIDVSAGVQGDAGSVEVFAPLGGVTAAGAIVGRSGGGRGGSLSLDTSALAESSALLAMLASGGVNDRIAIRVRTGDVTIGTADTVSAATFKLAADGGSIVHQGLIDASNSRTAGCVELYARNNLTLEGGSRIIARGQGAVTSGGDVVLAARSGYVRLRPGSIVDVSGGAGGAGGQATFRALREGGDVRLDLEGLLIGPSRVSIEAVRQYAYSGSRTILSSDWTAWQADTAGFMQNASAIRNRVLAGLGRQGWESGQFHVLPGIEVRSTGDLIVGAPVDLTSWRYAGEPGMLTLSAGGNLTVSADVVDHPTPLAALPGSGPGDSWGLRLVSGSDPAAADALAVMVGTGDLRIADGRMVYTESAPVRFASGRDTLIGSGAPAGYMIRSTIRYNVGTYDSLIEGYAGRDVIVRGGAIQSATGDIAITAERDLRMETAQDFGSTAAFTSLGSVRTTGQSGTAPMNMSRYWEYERGGNIVIRAGGAVAGGRALNAWDWGYGSRQPYSWSASYEGSNATEGLAAMGGGNLEVAAGRSVFTQAGTFGRGNLKIVAGGDVAGRFLVKDGAAALVTMGNFGSASDRQVIEMFNAAVQVAAQGDISLGAAVNPTIAHERFLSGWNLTYGRDAGLRLHAVQGNVTLYGDSMFYPLGGSISNLERIMPPSLSVEAGGDIRILNEIALAPSASGSLRLVAGGDIDGSYALTEMGRTLQKRAQIVLSDMDPAIVYGAQSRSPATRLFSRYEHAAIPLHQGDPTAVEIRAGRDIRNLQLYLAKQAGLTAGRDVRDIFYFGQNPNLSDVSRVVAGRDIYFSSLQGTNYDTGIVHGGPGHLVVQAGRSIDLGTTQGIQTVGNAFNSALSTAGSSLVVVSGTGRNIEPVEVASFFDQIRRAGVSYSELLAAGETDRALEVVREARERTVFPYLGALAGDGTGNINMVASQISTTSGRDDIHILAMGDLNVGKSSFFASEAERKSTGIYTSSGGAVNIFAGRDINVNESRIMTFRGGDITVWSDAGNINAGRGSKTAISVSPPRPVWIGDVLVVQFDPPAVGSGIRAVTYDPDGVEGPLQEPPPGDIYLFAPTGIIDAGEAGISGGKVFLGATQVLNAQNISFAFGSVGVPASSEGTVSIGAITGTGLLEQNKMMEQATGLGPSRDRAATAADRRVEEFMAKWLDVRVLGFEGVEELIDR